MIRKIFLFVLIAQSFLLSAQNGKIAGKVVDGTDGSEIIGAIVKIKNTGIGKVTDLDGRFVIENIVPGTYTIEISYVSYDTKELSGIVVKANEAAEVSVVLSESSVTTMEEFVVKGEFKKESINSFLLGRKKANYIGDGISAETIKQSPDNNSGEALKRVSGATLIGGKFAVIRGLSERYNLAMINNSPLPSTEPEKRAFALDLFPSSMLDQLQIVKSGTPDMPGDWAGGVIKIITKDIPSEPFFSVGVSGGANSLATFKQNYKYEGSKTDWLGFDNGYRQLPGGFPSTPEMNLYKSSLEGREKLSELGKSLNNNYDYKSYNAMPNFGVNINGGKKYTLGKTTDLGVIFSTVYNQSKSFQTVERYWWTAQKGADYNYLDSTFENNARVGGMLNLQLKTGENHKFTLKNTYNHNGENQFTIRNGEKVQDGQFIKSYSYVYTFNQVYGSQLGGEHYLPKLGKSKVNWEGGYAKTKKQLPDYRMINYVGTSAEVPKIASINNTPSENASRLFTDLSENLKSLNANIETPYKIEKVKGNVKAGGMFIARDRDFNARFLGYQYASKPGVTFDPNIVTQPVGTIFNPENFYLDDGNGNSGLSLGDITKPYHKYTASSRLKAGYLSLETLVGARHKFIYGARYESYNQKLTSASNSGPINIDTTWNNLLPSVNYIFNLNEKSNVRASYFSSVSRPEFRELAPFAFLDFQTLSIVSGSSNLNVTNIKNFDLRYEIYPNFGESFSFSVFYKEFKNPIELLLDASSTSGAVGRHYANLPQATNYGVEIDFRKSLAKLDTILGTGFFQNLTVSGNAAYIVSKIDLKGSTDTWNSSRPMQGQSPYIVNLGVQWQNKNKHWGASFLVNRFGERIYNVGTQRIPDIYEKARTILDIQVNKKCLKSERLEVKLSVSDLLAKNLKYFFDYNNNKKLDDSDRLVFNYRMPRVVSLGASYKF